MLTYEDCVGLSELTADEIDAIAEHEHIPAIVAAEMGRYLMTTQDGSTVLKRIILDDIEAARERGDSLHAACLRMVLRDFCKRSHISVD
ncbi:MAG: hypothetical protein EA356_01695 [Geminicoccaceae bacterium]|nr:MAG: hypothetical protein EA356_01695 [Geminicoccaceae bacterium]